MMFAACTLLVSKMNISGSYVYPPVYIKFFSHFMYGFGGVSFKGVLPYGADWLPSSVLATNMRILRDFSYSGA